MVKHEFGVRHIIGVMASANVGCLASVAGLDIAIFPHSKYTLTYVRTPQPFAGNRTSTTKRQTNQTHMPSNNLADEQ